MSVDKAAKFDAIPRKTANSIALPGWAACGLACVFLLAIFSLPAAAQISAVSEKPVSETISIRLSPQLGEASAAIEEILRPYSYVKIQDEAKFEIAPYPDFPLDLILIDREYWDDDKLQDAYRPSSLDIPENPNLPINIGRLDDDSFTAEIDQSLRKILRVKQLMALKNGENITRAETLIEHDDVNCPQNGDDLTWLCLSVRNDDTRPIYVYSLRIDARNNLTTLRPTNGSFDTPVPPGGKLRYVQKETELLADVQYYYLTISSRSRINSRMFNPEASNNIMRGSDWTVAITKTAKIRLPAYGGGGFTVPAFAAPWQVQLYSTASSTPNSLQANVIVRKVKWEQFEKVHRCAGTLIAPDVVLTAAHCVAKTPFAGSEAKEQSVLKYRRVKVGTQNLRTGGTTYAIDSVVVHKAYVPGRVYNDIALIKIKADDFTRADDVKHVKPILLPDEVRFFRKLRNRKKVSWYGWGLTGESNSKNTRIAQTNGVAVAQRNPAELRVGDMEILSREECKKRDGYSKVTKFMLCAVTHKDQRKEELGEHSFTCLGDSGGPIVREVRGKLVQVGVISWAVGCGANDNPSVSANLLRYHTWIRAAQKRFVSGKRVSFQENDN